MFKKITLTELSDIYLTFMVNDFPADELKPLALIQKLMKQGRYACYILEKENECLGYACFVWQDEKFKLLDYFAVNPKYRGQGIGSQMITWMKDQRIADTIILECEDPIVATTTEEKSIRERRLDFYFKNGAIKTSLQYNLLGVEFVILTLTIQARPDFDLNHYLISLYHMINPKLLSEL
ncbi:hypothetical protein CBF34_05765 [Vagococcus penaei]|uniref:Uncharacterized protein n=1 Tax=Vagococcus penaei TaxID=633807 RepID=A0A1Q2D3K9_9ENTE|nr:GNAT family N-acetyltransferase [Vagococcus penaei]AQP52960.1 hypothetical protein BW732_01125 [Vagococcus penaei]RSU02581.1 hypothetical protein CBF34_05765 [Vagococcus penaei]